MIHTNEEYLVTDIDGDEERAVKFPEAGRISLSITNLLKNYLVKKVLP